MAKIKSRPLLVADDIALDTDRERRSSAVSTCANELAKALGSSIDLMHVEDLFQYPVKTSAYKPLIERYFKDQKEKFAKVALSFQVPVKTRFIQGDPVRKILELAGKRNGYQLLVLGTQGRKGLSRIIVGSIAEEVIRQSRIPVMTLGPKAQSKTEFFGKQKLTILISTGLTKNSLRAEEYGIELAYRLGAKVVFFHSLRETLHPILQTAFSVATPPKQVTELFDQMREGVKKQLENKLKKAARRKVISDYLIDDRINSASQAILKQAEISAASLVVIGTHGRSLLQGAFFGRTARDVILESAVPVITVRSKRQ